MIREKLGDSARVVSVRQTAERFKALFHLLSWRLLLKFLQLKIHLMQNPPSLQMTLKILSEVPPIEKSSIEDKALETV